MTQKKQCRVFLSYNSVDRDFAGRLAAELERCGLEVWFDKWEIVPGDSLTSAISEGIEHAHIFVFVLSPSSVSSPWPKEELRAALAIRTAKPTFRIVPILRKSCRVPVFLRDYRRIKAPPGRHYAEIAQEFGKVATDLGFSLTGVPTVMREINPFFNLFSASSIDVTMVFRGIRGRVTEITENFEVAAKQRRFSIRRRIACEGTVTNLRLRPGVLEKKKLLPGTTAIRLRFDHARWQTQPLKFSLSYEVRDTFNQDDEFWFYNFQTAIRDFTASLVFEEPVTHCRCLRYQGEVEREAYPLQRDRLKKQARYRLRLVNPPYLEGVIFKWRWRR